VIHSHVIDTAVENRKAVKKILKQKCFTTNETFLYSFSEAVHNLKGNELNALPLYESLRDDFVRKRRINNFGGYNFEFEIPLQLQKTMNGEKFLYLDSGINDINKILIFTTEEFIERLKHSETWLGDGTFRMVPNTFQQLYVLHAHCFTVVLPVVFVLMKNKSEASYKSLFEEIKFLTNVEQEILFLILKRHK
jgi:hypothetical protein